MSGEIFISYASRHRDLTRTRVGALEAQYGAGSVWWDHELESRASYAEQIRAALEHARVVVVIWTAGAMISHWVYAEAEIAHRDGKLVNVRPADLSYQNIPPPFNAFHIDEAEDHEGILATVGKVMRGTPIPTRAPLHEIYFRHHGHRLVDPKQRPLPRDVRDVGPTDLLQAKYAIVPYIDIAGMRAGLIAWCSDRSRATAGRVVHGAGGLGKTRLMIEVAAALRADGWTAGFLDRPHEQVQGTLEQRWKALDQLIAHGDDSGLLLVLDYAEGRQDEVRALAERLGRRPDGDTRPIRIVLLARTAGEWWMRLHDELPDVQRIFRPDTDGSAVTDMPRIATRDDERALFAASVAAFKPTLELIDGCLHWIAAEPAETREKCRRTLLTVLQRATQPEHGPAAEWSGVLLDHLVRSHTSSLASDMVAVMIETPGTMTDRLDQQVGMLDTATLQTIDDALPMQSLALMELSLHVAAQRVKRERQLLVAADAANRENVLARLAARVHMFGLRLSDLGRHEEAASASKEGVDIYRQLAQTRPDTFLPHLAASLNNLGGWLSSLGRLNEALTTSQQAVDICRPLAEALPDAFLPYLAANLSNLGMMLSKLGRHAEALSASQEALDIRSRLALPQPDTFLPDLALSMNNVAVMLSNVERHEEALATSQEAVDIRRRLAHAHPDKFLPNMASSLDNLSSRFSNLGRFEEALAASHQAVDIYRQLVQQHPSAFLPNLASSLQNLGNNLSKLGRDEEALTVSQEAVGIHRQLAQTRPDAFHPNVAMGLGASGTALNTAGRHAEAVAAFHEGLAIITPFVEKHTQAFVDLGRDLDVDYLATCEKAGIEPDQLLRTRLVRALSDSDTAASTSAGDLIEILSTRRMPIWRTIGYVRQPVRKARPGQRSGSARSAEGARHQPQ